MAALGFLLNAIAHDLNNQLTNLMLGADQAQYAGSKDAIDLMVQQAQNLASITRAVQRLGQRNMSEGVERTDLAVVCRRFEAWYRASAGPGARIEVHVGEDETGPLVWAKARNLVLALSLLGRTGPPEALALPLSVHLGTEALPRSTWAGTGESVDMAVIHLRRGDPPRERTPSYRSVVDDFFSKERDDIEVGVMAAWEILRKVRGRPSARMDFFAGGESGHEVSVALPLAD